MQTPVNLGSPFGYPVFTANSTTSFDASGGTGNDIRVVKHPFDLSTYPVPTRKSIIRVTFDIVINSGVGPFLALFTSTGSADIASNPVNDRKTGLTSGTKTILLTPSTETTGAIGFVHNSLNPGDADFEIDNIVVEVIGCIADLPLDEGIGYQFHDRSSNHFDALASLTGVTHLVPKANGKVRVKAANASSAMYMLRADSILPENSIVSNVLSEQCYVDLTNSAQTLNDYRIRLNPSGSDLQIQRSDGSNHQTLGTVTAPSSLSDVDVQINYKQIAQ
jgi:hypothetical protein